ncbi:MULTISPECIES: hypothetical protein [unclassified Streptomyces]|uniref:hypothetical protein n=1 Tax=unclassified Streptomyces TaxID=2593676 RepID=UPI00365AD6D5
MVDRVEPVHLVVGEDIQARAESEVGWGGTAQSVGTAEIGMCPGVFESADGAANVPAEGLGKEVRAERAASVSKGVEDRDGVLLRVGVVRGGFWASA